MIASDVPPPLVADPDWEPVDPFPAHVRARSFVSPTGDGRLRVAYFRRLGDGRLVGRAWFGPGAAGPPGHAHGGAVAAVLDEVLGAAAWLAGHRALAANLTVDFRAMVPLGTDARFEGAIDRVDGRKIYLRARLTAEDGRLLAEAGGLFVAMVPAHAARFPPRDRDG